MRNLPARGELPKTTSNRLEAETDAVIACAGDERKKLAESRYGAVRQTKWFQQVLRTLAALSGPGERCMCCSGSESAQVEHYRGKATYPEKAFDWGNFLWLCGICNQRKGQRFDENCTPVNPLDESAWDFMFIDEFGNLCAKWDPNTNALNSRAVETITLYGLDRQALQEARLARLKELRHTMSDLVQLSQAGLKTSDELQERALEIHSSPMQPDVADFFLAGPGGTSAPFSTFLALADL